MGRGVAPLRLLIVVLVADASRIATCVAVLGQEPIGHDLLFEDDDWCEWRCLWPQKRDLPGEQDALDALYKWRDDTTLAREKQEDNIVAGAVALRIAVINSYENATSVVRLDI